MESSAISQSEPSGPQTLVAHTDWDLIVEAHQHTVLLSVLALGVRLHRAQEITQQAFARLFEQHQAGKLERLSWPGLAIRQARFLALDALERDKTAARIESALATSLADQDVAITPERRLLAKEQLAIAMEALTYCPPASQRVFRAVYEDPGVPHAVIAERVGLSVQRVRQILCEVRRRVRDALEEAK